MIANRYLYEHGCTPEQLAKIAVHQRDNACANPDAFFYGQPITVDDVLGSPHGGRPAPPARDRDALGRRRRAGRGAPRPRARRTERPAAWLLGAGECVTHKTITYAPSLTDTAIKPAADRAFAQAGIERSADRPGVAVRLLHDHGAGHAGGSRLLRQGRRVARFVAEHDLRWNGDFPLNTHGGQLSFSQPGLAGGMSHVTEAVRQVQQRGGERQVRDLEFAFVNGNGGIMSEECALVLGVEP